MSKVPTAAEAVKGEGAPRAPRRILHCMLLAGGGPALVLDAPLRGVEVEALPLSIAIAREVQDADAGSEG